MLDKETYRLLLLKFLESESFKDKVFLDIVNSLSDYSVISLGREEAYSLYLLRRDAVKRDTKEKQQFDNVIKNLKEYERDKILIHIIYTPDFGYYLFTGIDVECSLGYLSLPLKEL